MDGGVCYLMCCSTCSFEHLGNRFSKTYNCQLANDHSILQVEFPQQNPLKSDGMHADSLHCRLYTSQRTKTGEKKETTKASGNSQHVQW